MPHSLTLLLVHWAIMSVSLWVASHLFSGLRFESRSSLLVSALVLGFANALVKPVLVVLTLPLTVLTLGFFLLVVNALMLMLVSALVKGFVLSGFWTAFFAGIVIALLNLFFGNLIYSGGHQAYWAPMSTGMHGTWL